MKIGEIVYFDRGSKVIHGKLIAFDGDPSDPTGFIVQHGQSIHWLSPVEVHATRVEAGCSLLARLRRDRTSRLKQAHESAAKVEELDEQITELIRQFK